RLEAAAVRQVHQGIVVHLVVEADSPTGGRVIHAGTVVEHRAGHQVAVEHQLHLIDGNLAAGAGGFGPAVAGGQFQAVHQPVGQVEGGLGEITFLLVFLIGREAAHDGGGKGGAQGVAEGGEQGGVVQVEFLLLDVIADDPGMLAADVPHDLELLAVVIQPVVFAAGGGGGHSLEVLVIPVVVDQAVGQWVAAVVGGAHSEVADSAEYVLDADVAQEAQLAEIDGGDVEQLFGLALEDQLAAGHIAPLGTVAAGLDPMLLGDQLVPQGIENPQPLGGAGLRVTGERTAQLLYREPARAGPGSGVVEREVLVDVEQDGAAVVLVHLVVGIHTIAGQPLGGGELDTEAVGIPAAVIQLLSGVDGLGEAVAAHDIGGQTGVEDAFDNGDVDGAGGLPPVVLAQGLFDEASELPRGALGCEQHGAASGAAAEQGALRAFQHLHRGQVEHLGIVADAD